MRPGTAKGMYYEKHNTARTALGSDGDNVEQGVLGGYNNKNGQWNNKKTGGLTPLQVAAAAKRKSRKI